jgi:hypothetical protein
MRRSLFAREFRSALVPNLVTVGAILATLIVLGWLFGLRFGDAESIRIGTDVLLLTGLVASGFISGERCFPAEVKESRIFFLFSLPISRSWIWMVIVSARLLAGVASLALTVALRRPLLLVLRENSNALPLDILLIAAYSLFAYILFFAAGTLFALLFRRTLFSYVAGFMVLGLLLIETIFSISYSIVLPQLTELSISPQNFPDASGLFRTAAFLSALLISALLLCWRFFVRGEIANPKRRIRNQLLFGIIATAYLGFVFCVESSPKLASIGSTWKESNPFIPDPEQPSYGVSPDGRYLFIFESLDHRPFMVRVSIVDTRTGRVTGQLVSGGVGWGYWSSHGDVLNLLVLNNSPLDRWGYLAPGTVDWVRLSPDAREISKLHLKGVEAVKTLSDGRALAVLREGDQGKILLLDGASGRPSKIIQSPLDGNVVVQKDGPAALAYFDNILLPRRGWVVDSRAREVRVPRLFPETAYVLFGEIYGPTEAQTTLLRRFASPSAPGGTLIKGSVIAPRILTDGPEVKGIYFLEEREPDVKVLWARSTAPEGHWERLPDIAPHLAPFMESSNILENFVDPASGISAFLSGGGDVGKFFVYDPRLNTFLERESCIGGRNAFINIDRVPGLRGVLIELTCAGKAPSVKAQTYFFEHLSGSREVRAIKMVPTPDSQPWHLYFDEHGWEVRWLLNKEHHQEIWRSSPGTDDLRLWPPR